MKHLRLFENATTLESVQQDIDRINATLINMYKNSIKYIKKKYDIGYVVDIAFKSIDYTGREEIQFINTDGMLISNEGDEFDFEDLLIDSKVTVLNELNIAILFTYDYQKHIIKQEPNRISEIINRLHPKIEKEFPNLVTGKDLNLM